MVGSLWYDNEIYRGLIPKNFNFTKKFLRRMFITRNIAKISLAFVIMDECSISTYECLLQLYYWVYRSIEDPFGVPSHA